MLKIGTQTGSLTNHLYSRMTKGQPEPALGMGATILFWTDRHAATIVMVNGDIITVQEDKAIRTDWNGMSECQTYCYERNPEGCCYVFKRMKNGAWTEVRYNNQTKRWKKTGGPGLRIGGREHHHDYSF
jgi:hypothetical protein